MKTILLIITGSIAAYKALEVIRFFNKKEIRVSCILTKGGAEFVTPLSVAAISGNKVYQDIFDLKDETEMGHIRLSREADAILVAPASADIIAKIAHGLADDLASCTLLAAKCPIFIAPAMNSAMWENAATKRNIKQVEQDGVKIISPGKGELACGEEGYGRMSEPEEIVKALLNAKI